MGSPPALHTQAMQRDKLLRAILQRHKSTDIHYLNTMGSCMPRTHNEGCFVLPAIWLTVPSTGSGVVLG